MVDMEADMAQFEAAIREHREGLPKRLFWRESTAQHFDTLSGECSRLEAIKVAFLPSSADDHVHITGALLLEHATRR